MFFPSKEPKVSMSGRSRAGQSRAEVIKQAREDRERRQQRQRQQAASVKVQAFWRAVRVRRALREAWTQELAAMLDGLRGDSQRPPPFYTRYLSLVTRVYRPSDLHLMPFLVAACRVVSLGRAAPTASDFAAIHAARVCRLVLRTLVEQRSVLLPVLSTGLGSAHADATQQSAAMMVQTLLSLCNPEESTSGGHDVLLSLAADGLFPSLARILAAGLPPAAAAAAHDLRACEQLAARLLSWYLQLPEAAVPPPALQQHRCWALLCTPGLAQRSVVLRKLLPRLTAPALGSLRGPPAALLRGVAGLAEPLGFTDAGPARSGQRLCMLQLLAALAQGVAGSTALTQSHGIQFMRVCRGLLLLLPSAARDAVLGVGPSAAAARGCGGEVHAASMVDPPPVRTSNDADLFDFWCSQTPRVTLEEPRGAAVGRGRAGAAAEPWPAREAVHQVSVPVTLSSAKVASAVLASLGDPAESGRGRPAADGGAAEAATDTAAAGGDGGGACVALNEFALWACMLLSFTDGDAQLRQRQLMSWAAEPCGALRLMWGRGMQLLVHAREARTVADVATDAGRWAGAAQWGLLGNLPALLLPLTVFCAMFTQTLAASSNEVLFSEKAPVPLSELADPRGGFLAVARDSLFNAFMGSRQLWPAVGWTASHPARQAGMVPAVHAFKLLVGRFMLQMHERAARVDSLSDDIFHVPGLQSVHFHQEVNFAVNTDSLFLDQDDEDDAMEAAPTNISRPAYVQVLRYAPCLVPFHERAQVFQRLILNDQQAQRALDPGAGLRFGGSQRHAVTIRRDNVFDDGYSKLHGLSSGELKQRLRLAFLDEWGQREPGVDAGGLFKQFMENIIQEAFDPGRGLFLSTAKGELYPSPGAVLVDDNAPSVLRFLGCMLGKAMYEGIMVDLPFAGFFLKQVRGGHCDINDLPSLDPELYTNLMRLQNTGDAAFVESLNLFFTIASNSQYDSIREVPLMPGGSGVAVTLDNVPLYLALVADFRLTREIAGSAAPFLAGLTELIEPVWLRLFNDRELQQLISGSLSGGLDVSDLRRHVVLAGGYSSDHPVIRMLWGVLEQLTPAEQGKFLKFVTGCSRPPLLGFAAMTPRLAIHMRGHVGSPDDETALPSASTCFNLLKLPPYPSQHVMRSKLLLAIESSDGFELS